MFLIRGVLLGGKFRTHQQLNSMSRDDQRNTLIVEMVGHSNQSVASYQALDNDTFFFQECVARASLADRRLRSLFDEGERPVPGASEARRKDAGRPSRSMSLESW